MVKHRFLVAAIIAFAIFSVSGALNAQTSGVITGRVADPQGASVPDAEITLTHSLTGVKISTRSDGAGDFVFPSVLPGKYTVAVQMQGFKRLEKKDVTLTATERLSVGAMVLEVGAISDSVTVTAEATPVQTSSLERSAMLNDKQMGQLSTPGRDYMNMLKVLPGVSYQDGNGSQTLGAVGVPVINGGRNDYSSVNIDGVVGNNRGLGTTENEINLDAVAEVKVLMGNYQAEYGKNSGAVVNIVTKGGTQQFHGGGYWYKRHEMFNATNFFNNKQGIVKPRYRYNTLGYNIGGPIYWPEKFNRNKDKLFFFWSEEFQPNTRPGGTRTWTMPSELERKGDFSQSLQSNNALIVIKDPNTGSPFPGNVIPTARINPDTQKLLGVFPVPNFSNRAVSKGNYNYILSDSIDNPIRQDLLRVDYNPTSKWRTYFRGMYMFVNNNGTASTANTNSWGIVQAYNTTNPNVAGNVTYLASPTLVNEFSVGLSRWTEDQVISDSELARIQRDKLGIKIGQLYPQNNPLNLIPAASFGGVTGAPSIGFDARFPMYDYTNAWSFSDGVTKVLNAHTLKAGIYFEWAEYLQAHHAGSGSAFVGNFSFQNAAANPFDSNNAYSNALLGNFNNYQEVNNLVDYWPINKVLEWYVQDTWKVKKRLTLDYGIRFSYDLPTVIKDDVGGNFITSLYSRSKAPALYYPTLDSKNQRMALNPLTGEILPAAYIGRFVPNSGDPNVGSIKAGTPGYPRGFMQSNGVVVAPRFGFAYDPFGDGKTAIRVGAGIYTNARPRSGQTGDMAFNPPAQSIPVQYYGNVSTFLNASGTLAPANANKVMQGDAKLISSYNLTAGIQRNIGFGTVLDVAYVGNLGRHLGQTVQINTVPYGSRFLSQNQDKTTNSPLPDAYFRPYYGYGNLPYFEFAGTSSYHSLQTQVKRTFKGGLQFGAAWTYGKSMNYGDGYNDGVARFNDRRFWNYGPAPSDRTHTLVANWVWELPKPSRLLDKNRIVQWTLDNWQFSGIVAFTTGTPRGVGLSLSDGADLTGGGDGSTVQMNGVAMLAKDQRTPDRFFNTSVFARPAVGSIGSGAGASVYAFRGPGANNWDLTFFKNFPVREKISFQFRWEMYNAFNHTQFTSVNTTAQFDKSGAMINGQFGQVTGARDPRVQQMSLRLTF